MRKNIKITIKIVAMKNGTFSYSPKHSKIGEEEIINTLILKYNLKFENILCLLMNLKNWSYN